MVDWNNPSVSVIVPNFNGGRLAVECVSSILASSYRNFELLLVDNASTDSTLSEIESKFGNDSRLRIIRLDRNYAYTGAINVAFGYTRGELIVFMNNDTIAEEDWLAELVKSFLLVPNVGVAQAKLLQMDDPQRLQNGGGMIDTLGFITRRGRGHDEREYNTLDRIFFASGACLLTSRRILREVGLPDTKFLMIDDADLGWRVRLRGYDIVFVPSARVQHRGSATLRGGRLAETRIYQAYFEHLAMLVKNYSLGVLPKIMALVVFLRSLRILSFIANRRLALAKVAALGILRVVRESKSLWRDHLFVNHTVRRIPDSALMALMKDLQKEETLFGKVSFRKRRLFTLWSKDGRLLIRLG